MRRFASIPPPMNNSTLTQILAAQHAAKLNPDKVPSIQRGYAYPLQIWYFLASFIALVSIAHFSTLLTDRLRARKTFSPGERGALVLRRLPAAVHVFRTVAFRTTVSLGGYTLNFTEFFLGCAYIAIIFTWAFINTTSLEGERFSTRYYANRSGLIAASQFPLLIALGMKNNILTFFTGISFDKLNLLHRVVARVLCVLLWIHGGGRITQAGRAETLKDFEEGWFRWGFVSTIALTMLCFLSMRPIRSHGYEMFIVAHFFVAVILLVGSYIHTQDTSETRYVWPSFVIWGLDRSVRFVRTFLVNGGYLNLLGKKDAQTCPLTARVDVVSAHLLRVRVFLPDRFSWAPGQVAYLSVPRVSRTPWEAHPFSIANIDAEDETSASRTESGTSSPDEKRGSVDTPAVPTPGYTKELVFLLRIRGGFTKRLLDAATAGGSTAAFNAYVDGPYCAPPSVRGFGTVLLFAGGSGVSFTLPLLLDLIRGSKTGTNPACGRVVFVWAIRDREQIRAVSDTLFRAFKSLDPQSIGIEIRIHVTASVEDTDGDAESIDLETGVERGGEGDARLLVAFPFFRLCEGRPDVDAIVRTEVEAATGAMSVNVCGTRGLAEHVRRGLRGATSGSDVLRGGPSVSLHVESFGGA
ncbi:ferric reductase like transmembrane component-domain-containing protein [Mycena rosella]|uniref:ferric-chelate reductase (NADPH) n=1 Tax=Mycena rosella TaxID=1033263 RepID=A0AAD7D5R8_MYCRO|nr:ferric reductase like transmembrane component-domain-containing protein [Mycena rosella]